jgi:plasmid stabilization system protein ParE
MALKIRWAKRAEKSFDGIIVRNIEENWSEKSAKKFVQQTNKVLNLMSENPNMFPESQKKGIRKGLITKQTSVYYKVFKDIIRLIIFWDNRQNPKDLEY